MASDTVRISAETHAKLKEIAQSSGQSMPAVLDDAVEELRRKRLLEGTSRAFAALRNNPKAWQAELKERQLWEATLVDDLEEK